MIDRRHRPFGRARVSGALKVHSWLGIDMAWCLTQIPSWMALQADPDQTPTSDVPLFGVNVASCEDSACDDYLIERLREAGIQHVRLAWSVNCHDGFTERALDRLLDAEIEVMVCLLPDPTEAARIGRDEAVTARWRTLVRSFLERYAQRVSIVEIGNVPNRPKWSGYTFRSYLCAWQVATEELEAYPAIALAGANVTDFEPFFNVAYLRAMRRAGRPPAIHTDNLFVERAVQPEADDPSAAGRQLQSLVRLNLIKKINILSRLGQSLGVTRTFCTYTCWTRPRLARWSTQPDRKGADYVARYLFLSAANGALERLYWGPLIDNRDGLIDCGARGYPEFDNVAHCRLVRGRVVDFEPTPSFFAFGFVTQLLKHGRFLQTVTQRDGLNHLVFESTDVEHHFTWATDSRAFELSALYADEDLQVAQVRSVTGVEIGRAAHGDIIRESPLVLSWPRASGVARPQPAQIRKLEAIGANDLQHGLDYDIHPAAIESPQWRGAVNLDSDLPRTHAQRLLPEQLVELPVQKVLRDKRNKLWTIQSPLDDGTLVVKLNRAKGIKRFSYLFLPSKGKRHWNNATEMLRRGINTPPPVAYAERRSRSGVRDNYYLSEYVADAFSTRDLFAAFSEGAQSYRGLERREWLQHVVDFVARMHNFRIVHNDLSSGNLLITLNDGVPTIYAIDIGRAKTTNQNGARGDLKRICYKLNWSDRETFIEMYGRAVPGVSLRYWRLLLRSYDLKLRMKRMLKGRKAYKKP